MTLGVCELLWPEKQMKKLGLKGKIPFTLYCDNKAAISIANNQIQQDQRKYIEIDMHFINEKLSWDKHVFHL